MRRHSLGEEPTETDRENKRWLIERLLGIKRKREGKAEVPPDKPEEIQNWEDEGGATAPTPQTR